ncbi:hypothetical protein RSAG8_02278, partial [Rhizoctonia solani AG-8 WAC10335]
MRSRHSGGRVTWKVAGTRDALLARRKSILRIFIDPTIPLPCLAIQPYLFLA